jgi:hypothetical protein
MVVTSFAEDYTMTVKNALGRTETKSVRATLDPLPINPAIRLRTPDERELHAILDPALRKAILEQSDAVQVLANVKRQWQQRDEKQGAAARTAAYRLSLGR